MISVSDFFSNLLRGDFLVKGNAQKNWKVIFAVLSMSIVMITCSHQTDEKIIKKGKLQKKIKVLKAEYLDSATKVTRLKMESSVAEKVKQQGLVSGIEPPVKIVVKTKQ